VDHLARRLCGLLLLVALAGRGFIPPELGIVLVLGVNLGSSVIAPLLTRRAEPGVRVVPIGNLLMRGVGSLVMLILFLWSKPPIGFLGASEADQIINAHILFNCIILLAGLPLAGATEGRRYRFEKNAEIASARVGCRQRSRFAQQRVVGIELLCCRVQRRDAHRRRNERQHQRAHPH